MADVVKPSPHFWSGKRVLILGQTGFKGAWLSIWLSALGAKVSGCALPAEDPSLFAACGLEKLIDNHYADIRDKEAVAAVTRKVQPEIVLHLAAQSLVRLSYQQPVETFATNVMGTVHVLAAAREVESVRSIIIITSDKCYENREWFWPYREDEPLGGHDPYSSSKGCAELVTAAWRASFSVTSERTLGIASARAGNVIGGGDWAKDRLIPDCVRALRSGKAIAIRNPASTRPWQHVLDPLCGYLLLAERLTAEPRVFGEAWNFGPRDEDAQPVGWIADRIVQSWGDGASWRKVSSDELHEASFLKVDASKARTRLRWSQALHIDAALDWSVEWYKEFFAGRPPFQLTEQQIARFGTVGG